MRCLWPRKEEHRSRLNVLKKASYLFPTWNRLRGRVVHDTPHDSMSLERFRFLTELSTRRWNASGLPDSVLMPTAKVGVNRRLIVGRGRGIEKS
jgi:hypothetical protein